MLFPSNRWRAVLSTLSLVGVLGTVGTGCAADTGDEEVGEDSSEVKGKKKPVRFDVLEHNIGGGAENDPGATGIAYTFSQIDARQPDVVMLEEVCLSQYTLMKQRYSSWNVLFSQMRESHPGCANSEAKGQVLASRHPMPEVLREDLGDVDPSGNKHFTLLCGSVSMPKTARKVISCVTHLRAQDTAEAEAARGRQAQRIHGHVKGFVNDGREVVIGGDFNASPHRAVLDPLYRLTRSGGTGGGLFDEADQTDKNRQEYAKEVTCAAKACRSGEGTMTTNNSKLDFVFFSTNRIAGDIGANPLSSGGSGHRLYTAFAELNL